MTMGKWDAGAGKIGWHNYLGIIQRGHPESLIIYRLPDRYTKKRAPGPGPIRLGDWKPTAENICPDVALCYIRTALEPTHGVCLGSLKRRLHTKKQIASISSIFLGGLDANSGVPSGIRFVIGLPRLPCHASGLSDEGCKKKIHISF